MTAPTVEEILDAIAEFADYEEENSVSRARSYITACRRFLALPSTSSDQGSSMGYTPQAIQAELDYARRWAAANDTSSSRTGANVRFLSAQDGFRR